MCFNKKLVNFLFGLFAISNIAFAQNNADYTYSRDGKEFKIFNSEGQDISNSLEFISNFDSLFYYVYDPKNETLLKLSYLSAAQNEISAAEIVFINKKKDFVYFGENGEVRFYCESKEMYLEDILVSSPNQKLFVMSPKTSKMTYTFLYTEGEVGIKPLELIRQNDINSYWSKVLRRGDVTKTDLAIYINGASPKSLEKLRLASGMWLFSIKDEYYKTDNYKSSQFYALNDLHKITKETYDSIVSIEDEKIKIAISPVGKCKSDVNCLLSLSEEEYNKEINKSASKEKAYDAMTDIFVKVYNISPSDSYKMFMKVKSEHMMSVLERLPKDIRAHIRGMSMKTIKDYEQKYGSPEIKTVPYIPKNNN